VISVKVQWPSGEAEVLSFEETEVSIGRSVENEITISTSTGVSRRHARLFVEGGLLYLEDLGSTNGTLVNSTNVLIEQIEKNDVIQIGQVKLQALFRVGEDNKLSGSNDIYEETKIERKEDISRDESKVNEIGISKLKQLTSKNSAKKEVSNSSTIESFVKTFLPKIWEQISKANIESILLQHSKAILTTIEGEQEHFEMQADQGVLDKLVSKIVQNSISEDIYSLELNSGLKVSCVKQELSASGDLIIFEKAFTEDLSMDELIELGVIELAAAEWLRFAVERGRKVIVSCSQEEDAYMFAQALARFVPQNINICALGKGRTFSLSRDNFQSINIGSLSSKSLKSLIEIMRRANHDYFLIDDLLSEKGGVMLKEVASNSKGAIACVRALSVAQALSRVNMTIANSFSASSQAMEVKKEVCASVNVVVHLRSARGSAPLVEQIQQVLYVDQAGDFALQEIFLLPQIIDKSESGATLDA